MKKALAMITAGMALFAPAFRVSEHSLRIYNMQLRLQDLGYYNLKPTGTYAGLTQTVVSRFQQNNDFPITKDITQEELAALHSPKAAPQYKRSAPRLATDLPLEQSTWEQIELPTNCTLLEVESKAKYTFSLKEKKGYAAGLMEGSANVKKHKKTAVVATIQGKHYPASMEVTGSSVCVYFLGSTNDLGLADAEHNHHIQRLLGR